MHYLGFVTLSGPRSWRLHSSPCRRRKWLDKCRHVGNGIGNTRLLPHSIQLTTTTLSTRKQCFEIEFLSSFRVCFWGMEYWFFWSVMNYRALFAVSCHWNQVWSWQFTVLYRKDNEMTNRRVLQKFADILRTSAEIPQCLTRHRGYFSSAQKRWVAGPPH